MEVVNVPNDRTKYDKDTKALFPETPRNQMRSPRIVHDLPKGFMKNPPLNSQFLFGNWHVRFSTWRPSDNLTKQFYKHERHLELLSQRWNVLKQKLISAYADIEKKTLLPYFVVKSSALIFDTEYLCRFPQRPFFETYHIFEWKFEIELHPEYLFDEEVLPLQQHIRNMMSEVLFRFIVEYNDQLLTHETMDNIRDVGLLYAESTNEAPAWYREKKAIDPWSLRRAEFWNPLSIDPEGEYEIRKNARKSYWFYLSPEERIEKDDIDSQNLQFSGLTGSDYLIP